MLANGLFTALPPFDLIVVPVKSIVFPPISKMPPPRPPAPPFQTVPPPIMLPPLPPPEPKKTRSASEGSLYALPAAPLPLTPSVIHRKVMGSFRSDWDAQTYATLATVLNTAKRNRESAFQKLAQLMGTPVLPFLSQPDFA